MAEVFQVRRDDLSETRIQTRDAAALKDGHIRLKVDAFAYTANNITYGIAGDRIGYWKFFPATDGWGILPVWGFGDVIESRAEGLEVGTRVFGYFPPATAVDMEPINIGRGGFTDNSEHRRALPAGYNAYRLAPQTDARSEAERMLLFPLHITSWCLWDSLVVADWHGLTKAEGQVVVLSASSKTALGLGHALKFDDDSPASIGMTSPSRVDTVGALDLYDDVLGYESILKLPVAPTVVVDMSGNSEVLNRLADHLGDDLRFISRVGITHWDDATEDSARVRKTSKMFFAPGHIAARMKEWGPAEFNARSGAFLADAAKASRDWLEVRHLDGLQALSDIHDDVLNGRRPASEGLIVEL